MPRTTQEKPYHSCLHSADQACQELHKKSLITDSPLHSVDQACQEHKKSLITDSPLHSADQACRTFLSPELASDACCHSAVGRFCISRAVHIITLGAHLRRKDICPVNVHVVLVWMKLNIRIPIMIDNFPGAVRNV